MLHIHFGTGRLGLGLVAPFFQAPGAELYLLNRATSARNATGTTGVDPSRRNELLKNNPRKEYLIETAGTSSEAQERLHYDGFYPYSQESLSHAIQQVLEESTGKADGIIVTASVLTVDNYGPVVAALNTICKTKSTQQDPIGDIYLVACENTVSAYEVLDHQDLAQQIEDETRRQVRCVHALVDRVCVGLEEVTVDGEPTLAVRAEDYGSLKLELCPHTVALPDLLKGSKVEFSRYLDIEKEIKSWLLNGSHWLIALTAFQESGGNPDLKLNDFITLSKEHTQYAQEVLDEMREGIEALLRSDARFEDFVRDVNVKEYLQGAASTIFERFKANDDTITRILARFRAPTPDEVSSVQKFIDRFLHRIEEPLVAYQQIHGTPPKSATQGIFNLFRLQASGTYVDTAKNQEQSRAA